MRSTELRRYFVAQPNGDDAVLKLTADDAERLGARPVDAPADPPPVKARRSRNKARRAPNKADG